MAQQLDANKLQPQVQAKSFDALYNHFASTLFHYLYRQVSHAQDAEDLLLEVFLAALKYEPLYALSAERQLAWLRHVARNKVVDRYRRRVLLTMLPLEQASETEDSRLTPVVMTHSCPASLGRPFASGDTITIHQYTPLTSSGRITLSEHVAYDGSDERTASAFRLLEGHWPSISIYVDAKVPQDRTLTLKRVGNQVTVLGPKTARPLLYAYDVSCNGPQGNTWTGNFAWEVQPTSMMKQTNCPGQHIHWNYAVAAVGYAIASGSADFP